MFKYYSNTVRYQRTCRRGPQLSFLPALGAQSSPPLQPDLCCPWMKLTCQKGWRRWSRATALTLVPWGPLPFTGRVENPSYSFPSPLPMVWPGLEAEAAHSLRHQLAWHCQAERRPQHPGPMPTFPLQVGKITQLRTGSPHRAFPISAQWLYT